MSYLILTLAREWVYDFTVTAKSVTGFEPEQSTGDINTPSLMIRVFFMSSALACHSYMVKLRGRVPVDSRSNLVCFATLKSFEPPGGGLIICQQEAVMPNLSLADSGNRRITSTQIRLQAQFFNRGTPCSIDEMIPEMEYFLASFLKLILSEFDYNQNPAAKLAHVCRGLAGLANYFENGDQA